MDNGPARKEKMAQKLQEAGDLSGDMFEISTIRREVMISMVMGTTGLPRYRENREFGKSIFPGRENTGKFTKNI